MISGWIQDLRYAVRRLWQTPVFSSVVVLTLALGLGVNTAVFTVADRAVLRAVPFPEPDRLVKVWQTSLMAQVRVSLSYPQIEELSKLPGVLESGAAFQTRRVNLAGQRDPVELSGVVASADLFRVLGVAPRLGRAFTQAEERDPVVLLSYRLWVTRWGADPAILGRQLTIDNQPHTIIGVLPPQATFPSEDEQLWLPVGFAFRNDPELATRRERSGFEMVGRLAPGVSLAGFQKALDQRSAAEAESGKDKRFTTGFVAGSLSEDTSGAVRPALLVLFGAALLVLVIACANAAALLIARATGRQREIALRQVLGAGPARVARQLVLEHLLLALAAGVVGGILAQWGLDLLAGAWPSSLPRASALDAPARVFGFTFLLSLLTGVGFGLVPALWAVRPALEPALRAGGNNTIGARQRRRALNTLVGAQLALSLVLLVGAGLLLQSFLRLGAVDPGFQPDQLLAARVRLTPERYPARSGQDAFFASLQERVRALPNVRHVALASTLPLGGSNSYTILDPREIRPDDPEEMLLVGTVAVGDDYPAALGLSLLAGRGFSAEDRAGSPRVAIVSQALARRLWGKASPLGKQIPLSEEDGLPVSATVIGVAADQRYGHLDDDPEPAMYLPRDQVRNARAESWILIRVTGETQEIVARVREAVRSLDAGQPIGELVSMTEVVSRSTAARRFNLLLVAAFATLALILAVLGIAGVTAYSLSQRSRELGIRVALGAERRDLLTMGLGETGRVVAISAAVGLVAAFGAARTLRAMLFGVGPSDPLTYVGVTLLLAAAAFLASYLPIRRAADADPMVTLRTD